MQCRKCKSELTRRHHRKGHVLLCGDSTSIDAVEKLMNGEKADMVFTDPPYGINLDSDFTSLKSNLKNSSAGAKSKNGGRAYDPIIGDDKDFDPGMIFGYFKDCPEIFLWGADYYAEKLIDKNSGSWIVWDKVAKIENHDGLIGSNFELCWSKQKHKRLILRHTWSGYFGTEREDSRTRIHPTQKPIDVATWFFERWGKPQDKVIDLFGGSGSTLIACEKTNRKCFMMELDPHYCDVILARWEKFTGQKAKLLTQSSDNTADHVIRERSRG